MYKRTVTFEEEYEGCIGGLPFPKIEKPGKPAGDYVRWKSPGQMHRMVDE